MFGTHNTSSDALMGRIGAWVKKPSRTMVHGTVAAGFEPVREAFARNFIEFGEQGAATAIYVQGRKVVDLWGGIADHTTGRPWTEDTLSLVWSTTKSLSGHFIGPFLALRYVAP